MQHKYYFLLLTILSVVYSCSETNAPEDVAPNSTTQNIKVVDTSTANYKAKNFIYSALKWGYVFRDEVVNLSDTRFSSLRNYELFLDKFNTPEALWEELIVDQDRFSLLFSNLNNLPPLSRLEFDYRLLEKNNETFIVITRVEENSDAETKGIRRGMIFNTLNGSPITNTITEDLISLNSFEIEEATFTENGLVGTGNTFSINKSNIIENPIGNINLLEIEDRRIIYFQFNSFLFPPYDEILNDNFAFFPALNATDFVLDLRYNGGGSVDTANRLISLLTGQFNNDVLSRSTWNRDRQQEFRRLDPRNVVTEFPSTTFENEVPLNSLGLNKIYILTSKEQTASASEILINSLKPYIDVVVIGDAKGTVGKSRASQLIYNINNNLLTYNIDDAGVEHNYYTQLLVYQISNKNNETVSPEGITPDIIKTEDFNNLGVLGSADEPLLKAAIDDILGNPQLTAKGINTFDFGKQIGSSEDHMPSYQRMYSSMPKNIQNRLPNLNYK